MESDPKIERARLSRWTGSAAKGRALALDRRRGHRLLPREIEESLPALYSFEKGGPKVGEASMVLLKVFDACGRGSWYATEFDPEDGTCFGFVQSPLQPDFDELGYFNLWELGTVRNRMGIPLERDCHWTPCPLDDVVSGKRR